MAVEEDDVGPAFVPPGDRALGVFAAAAVACNFAGSGIVTSETNAKPAQNLTTLGVATAAAAKGISGAETASFAGQTVNPADVLIMYTYNGDANVSGNVDADDYFQIDSGYSKDGAVTGFFNGDFNYDGVIDGDDYLLIDAGFMGQGAPFLSGSTGGALAGVAAVPEPTALSLFALAAASMTRRRRRA